MWLQLSENLYYFGNGGVNRAEETPQWSDSRKNGYQTNLYTEKGHAGTVKETIQEIRLLLTNKQ